MKTYENGSRQMKPKRGKDSAYEANEKTRNGWRWRMTDENGKGFEKQFMRQEILTKDDEKGRKQKREQRIESK